MIGMHLNLTLFKQIVRHRALVLRVPSDTVGEAGRGVGQLEARLDLEGTASGVQLLPCVDVVVGLAVDGPTRNGSAGVGEKDGVDVVRPGVAGSAGEGVTAATVVESGVVAELYAMAVSITADIPKGREFCVSWGTVDGGGEDVMDREAGNSSGRGNRDEYGSGRESGGRNASRELCVAMATGVNVDEYDESR